MPRSGRLSGRLGRAVACLLMIGAVSCGGPPAESVLYATLVPSFEPSPSVEETATATATPDPTATPRANAYVPDFWADYGSHAVVLADGLNVRLFLPGLDSDVVAVLAQDDDVLVVDGPVALDGYEWYLIEFAAPVSDNFPNGYGIGWVAGHTADGAEAGLMRIDQPNCPSDIQMPLLARLPPWAVSSCEVEVDTVVGIVDTCFEGPITPFSYEPGWAWFSCQFLRDEGAIWAYYVYFPPDATVPDLRRGDLVTLTGRFGFDTAEYGACNVTTDEPEITTLEVERLVWQLQCQNRFVVSSGTIDGHVELPPQF